MEDVEIKQTRGPTLRFRGTLLAEEEWEARGGDIMRLELWQTEGGALIPVSEGSLPQGRPGERDVRAAVIEAEGDVLDMRLAVMDFFDWENRARSMVRKRLKWSLARDIA